MNRFTIVRAVALATSLWGAQASVCGAPVFRFGADSGSYAVLPGGQVAIPIFLQEESSDSDPSIIASEGGLFSVGLRVEPVAPQQGAATVRSRSDVSFNPQFTDEPFVQGLAPLAFVINDETAPGPLGQVISDGVLRVPVATVTFTVGETLGQTTTFRISDFNSDPNSADTGTYAGLSRVPPTELAVLPGEFSITVVPEPAGMIVVLLCLATAARPLRQRRQAVSR